MGLQIERPANMRFFLAVTKRQRARHWCSRSGLRIPRGWDLKMECVMTLTVIWSEEMASSSFLVPRSS